MSKEKKEFEPLSVRERKLLDVFGAHILKKIREDICYEGGFFDPRDDEMMSEIYPRG